MYPLPVLLDLQDIEEFNTILRHRNKAGVRKSKVYVFGIPNKRKDRDIHISATAVISKFAELCVAKKGKLLRGTELRKHFATESQFNGADVERNSRFMGHNENIHCNICQVGGLMDVIKTFKKN